MYSPSKVIVQNIGSVAAIMKTGGGHLEILGILRGQRLIII